MSTVCLSKITYNLHAEQVVELAYVNRMSWQIDVLPIIGPQAESAYVDCVYGFG